jgi:hypothetical protein
VSKQTHPDPDFNWLVPARANIQQALLDLRNFGTTRRIDLLKDAEHLARPFVLLVGAAFSLWRAAFLSDITQSWEWIVDKANELLEKLLITNTVSFSTDRDLRIWMMGYYLNSAGFRLDAARETLGSVPESHVQHRFDELHGRGGLINVQGEPNKAWDAYFDAFRELFTILRDRADAHSATSDCA